MPPSDVESSWFEAGRWDAGHGLMPMPTWWLGISPGARTRYARGYREALRDRVDWIGVDPNPYRTAVRPRAMGSEP